MESPLGGQHNVRRKKMTKQLTGKRDDTPLHSAARAGNLVAMKQILTDTNQEDLKELLIKQNQSGETALYVASEYGYVDLVSEMMKYYDVSSAGAKARNGYDALHIASKQGDADVLKILLEALPELSMTVDLSNTTALHTAATQGHIEVVNLLLEADANLAKIARSNGKTTLHSAARNGHLEVVKALLNKDPSTALRTDKKGQTALHMAVKGQNMEVVEELLKYEPLLINLMDTKGNTALHIATRKGRAQDQLRLEMEAEIKKSGRVSLIDLSDIIGVDLYHIERQAQQIVSNDLGLMLIQGEIISQSYWDNVAEEINEKLEECSQIALAEIAAQYHVGSELVLSVLEPRLGTLVKGRLEGGQLYTPAYVARVSAMVRGASRGITVPTNLPTVWNSLQQLLHEMVGSNGVSVETAFLQSLFNGLVKEGEILGSLRAGVQWTPSVFAHAQRESVDSFFSQNSFISYDVLHKLSIPQPRQYLQSRYPDGIPLDNVFIHPSMVDMLDAAVQDAIDHGNWIEALSVLPASIGSHDASKLLSLSPSVQKALKSSKAVVLGESCIFSSVYIKDLFDKMEKELETLGYSGPAIQVLGSSQSNEAGHDDVADKTISEKGSKRKKGKSAGSAKAATTENDPASQENLPTRSKKNQRRNKEIVSTDVSGVKMGNRKAVEKLDENQNIPSEEWVLQKIMTLAPDLEEMGDPDDPQRLLRHLSFHLRPMLVSSWKKRRSMLVVETAERRRRLLDNLQRQLDEAYLDLQLYEKALELFEDEPSTSIILHKHLLKTMATGIVDKFLLFLDMDNKLKNGIEVEDNQTLSSVPLNSGERSALAKNLSGPLSVKAQATVEALEGKRVDAFLDALGSLAEECGLMLKKLDKKLERALLHSYRKDLMLQISSEIDSVALLPKVIALLYLQVHNKALQAPGRAISAALSRLKDKVPDSTFKILTDYHTATVTLLALLSAATGEEDDCTSDRILSKRELLESKMPELKGLVLGNTNS